MSERFRQPENFDRAAEGAGWKLYIGANDWEHAPTWMACLFPGDEENKRVWIEVNYDGHGNPDDGKVRYDGPEAKEAKAWGEKAQKTWLRIAKKLRSEKTEQGWTRQWIDAFKDALKDEEMTPFIKSKGTDRTKWESVKESKRVVAKLLEDDDLDRLTDEVAANGYAVVATGDAGQKLYWVPNHFRFSSYAKDAQVFVTPEGAKEALQHAQALTKYQHSDKYQNIRVEVWLGESDEVEDFMSRIDQHDPVGYYVICKGSYNPHSPEAGQASGRVLTWYWVDDEDLMTGGKWILNRERASKYNVLPLAVEVQRLLQDDHPNYKVEIIRATVAESEADEFLDRVGDDNGEYVAILQGEATQRPHYLNSHAHWSLQWSDDVPCSQAEAMRRLIRNTSEHPTNAQYSKIVPRAEAFDYQSAWYESRNDVSFKKTFDLFFKFWGKGWDASGKRRHESLDEAVYKRSSCQINAPDDIKDFLLQWGMLNIPDDKLYVEADGGCGREDELHVTVRYGLDFAEPPEEFHRLITSWQAFPIRLAGVSLFKNEKFDVVKLDVVSDDLIRLNEEIRRQFPSQIPDKFPDYHPHMTIAYVQPGTCDALEGSDPFKQSLDVAPEFTADRLRFAGSGDTEKGDRVIQFIPFNKSKSTEQRREEMAMAESDEEADDFLERYGQWVIAMIHPPQQNAAPVYLKADGKYSYISKEARVFAMKHEADEELVRQRPGVPKEYTLKVVPLHTTAKVKPFGPAPGEFSESEEADDFIDRMKLCVLANVPPANEDAFTCYLTQDGDWGGIREAFMFMTREEAAVPLKKWQEHYEQKYGSKADLRVLDYDSELRKWGLTQKTVHENDEVDDLLGRMEPRRYALRFNFRTPRRVGSVPIKDPWWNGHYWAELGGSNPYTPNVAEAENHKTFEHAWDARVALAQQLNISVQDIDIVTHIGDKIIAMDGWPNRKGFGESAEPFGPLNFPADASEVLTKIRARRSKRGAPAWF